MNEQDQVEIFESLLQQTVDRLFDKYDGNFDRLDKQEQELVYIFGARKPIFTTAACSSFYVIGAFLLPKRPAIF